MEVAVAAGVTGGVVAFALTVFACRRCCRGRSTGYSLVSHELDREELDFKRALESQCGVLDSLEGGASFNATELEQIEMIEQLRNKTLEEDEEPKRD